VAPPWVGQVAVVGWRFRGAGAGDRRGLLWGM